MIHSKNPAETVFFSLGVFPSTPELFVGYSLLQISLYSISVKYLNKKSIHTTTGSYKTINLHTFGAFIFTLTSFLLHNESVCHCQTNFIFSTPLGNDYLAFLAKEIISITLVAFFLSLKPSKAVTSLSNSFEYYSFISSAALGSMLLCSANDFITAYLAIELQSISFYLMACSKKNSGYSIESGLKYFIIGSFSSTFLLLGVSFIYFSFGSFNFYELQAITSPLGYFQEKDFIVSQLNLEFALLGLVFVGVSIFVKLSVAPFHLWSIDVYESSPTTTTYFFAVVPKLGLFVFLVKIFYTAGYCFLIGGFSQYCFLFAVVSLAVGAFGGLEQRRLKSLLAYSSVGHTGYALLSFSTCTKISIVFMLYYLAFYMLSSLCFWFVFIFLKQKFSNSLFSKSNKELGDLTLLRVSNPILAIILGVVLFSLAGIPPVIGFLIKFGAFLTTIQASSYLLGSFGILLTIISTFYYLRVVKTLFFENSLVGKLYYPVNSIISVLIVISFYLLLIFFIKPSLMYLLALKSYLVTFS